MRKTLFILASFLLVGGLARVALATPAPKVWVCKFIGKPGVDERLQTGNNPISVSENAIKDFQGVGSYFNDAQGRSLVVAVDIGQDEPTCPAAPVTPPKDETPPTTPPTTTTTTTPSANVTVEVPEITIGK